MGFWSALGKIGGMAADIGSSFIPGGSVMNKAVRTGLSLGGKVLGDVSSAATQNRGAQIDVNQAADRTRLQGDQNFEANQQNRATLGANYENNAYRNAMRSALALHTKDASFSRPPGVTNISFSGGARPSAIGSEGQDAAALMNHKAMSELMNGPQLDPLQHFAPTAQPKPGFAEKWLGPISTGLSIAGQIGRINDDPDEAPIGQVTPQNAPGQLGSHSPMRWPVLHSGPLGPQQPQFSNVRF